MSYHQVTIVGNLGRDPEMRYSPSGQPVTNLSIATNRSYNSQEGEQKTETTWFRVAVWGRPAEACAEYLKKGRQVLVVGRLVSDTKTGGPKVWQGQNGPGASFEINADTVRFLGSSNGNGHTSEAAESEEDNIPF